MSDIDYRERINSRWGVILPGSGIVNPVPGVNNGNPMSLEQAIEAINDKLTAAKSKLNAKPTTLICKGHQEGAARKILEGEQTDE